MIRDIITLPSPLTKIVRNFVVEIRKHSSSSVTGSNHLLHLWHDSWILACMFIMFFIYLVWLLFVYLHRLALSSSADNHLSQNCLLHHISRHPLHSRKSYNHVQNRRLSPPILQHAERKKRKTKNQINTSNPTPSSSKILLQRNQKYMPPPNPKSPPAASSPKISSVKCVCVC